MATLAIEHIVEDEKGRPVIAGTRLRVSQVAEYISYDWTPGTDMSRFTDPNHPDFWRLDDPTSSAYRGDI